MLELLTPRQMAEADRLTIEGGIPGITLMDHAGRVVARAIRARFKPCRTLVLCGPGNNGGDGYVVARLLAQAGWPVTVAAFAAPKRGTDAAAAASRWRGPTARFGARAAGRADLVIDAVFGAGLARDVDGVTAETLRAAKRVVAIDVPSGVDGETGAVRGFAPQAALTVTFFRRKPGHVLLPGRDLCGEIVLADIGMPAKVLGRIRPSLFSNGPGLWTLRRPSATDQKCRAPPAWPPWRRGMRVPGWCRSPPATAWRTTARPSLGRSFSMARCGQSWRMRAARSGCAALAWRRIRLARCWRSLWRQNAQSSRMLGL
jgi:hydroxyethylthiazole kinase-like uncharacterized protein yjeF